MSVLRMLSLVPPSAPPPSERHSVEDVEKSLSQAVPLLHAVAHALATTDGLTAAYAAPQLREETFQLRAVLAHVLGDPPLGQGPQRAAPKSAEAGRKKRTPALDIQDASLEVLIEGLDLGDLIQAASALPQNPSEGLREAADALAGIASLFDVAVAKDAPLEIAREPVAVASLLEHVTRATFPVARARKLTVLATSDVPTVLGDPDLLRRALAGLLDRAIAAMPDGSTCELAVTSSDRARVELSFTGTFRAPSLELSLVRHALAAHGSDLRVEQYDGRTVLGFALSVREKAARLRRVA